MRWRWQWRSAAGWHCPVLEARTVHSLAHVALQKCRAASSYSSAVRAAQLSLPYCCDSVRESLGHTSLAGNLRGRLDGVGKAATKGEGEEAG